MTQKDQHVAGSGQKHWHYLLNNNDTGAPAFPECIPVRSAADDASMFSCPLEDCIQPATETVQRRLTTNSIIAMINGKTAACGAPRSLFYTCFCRQRTLSTVRLGNSR